MKRILVALDASPRTPFVRDSAADLAARLGAKLVLFRSIGLPSHIDEPSVTHPVEALPDVLRHEAAAELERHAASLPAGIVESCKIHIGVAWESIVNAAKECDADVIVIGSHGYSGLDRLLGTTAAKVVNHADRTVMVVRERR